MTKKKRTPQEVLGRMLRDLRQDAGVTQEELAKHLTYKGNTNITRIETGKRSVRLWEFIEICQYLEVNPSELVKEFLESNPSSFIPPTDSEG